MKCFPLWAFACATLIGSVFSPSAQAGIITFGSGSNEFGMEFVEIGSPGNAADTTGNPNPAGAVNYMYNLGKFEVSRDMIEKANDAGGLGITMHDMSFVTGGPRADMPATAVSWNEAARFVNWLNTSEGYAAAYNFALQPGDMGYDANANIQLWEVGDAGYDAANPFRNSEANYVLPTFDEWYKAAYYDPVTETYFDYPTTNGAVPTAVAGGTADNTAVYGQISSQGPADVDNAGGLSPFGVMGLGGNVWEWEETEYNLTNDNGSSARGIRGGGWSNSSGDLSSSARDIIGFPAIEYLNVGFRVASLSSPTAVPEPGSCVLLLTGVAGLGWYGRRRVRK